MTHTVIGANARRPNPALQPLAFLLGVWSTTGSHPALPGTVLPGTTSFEWAEGGAFLLMRSQTDHKSFPDGIALFGGDHVLGTLTLCWFDERGVSRICPVFCSGARSVCWHHDDPAFMQRLTIIAAPDGQRMTSKGEMAKDGGPWTDDLSQVFVRSARQL
jgi:hypothetical protein